MNTNLFPRFRYWIAMAIPIFFLIILLLQFSQPAVSAPSAPNTEVCGQITSNTTWTSVGSPYTVTCDIQVTNGITLTIQPNVIVKFNLGTSLQVDGTLIAEACTFTTNDPTPAKGDWGHIYFTVSSVDATYDANGNYTGGSKIQDCLVEWGGGGEGVNGAIEVDGASPFIYLNTVRQNGDSGIHATGRSSSNPVVLRENNVNSNSGSEAGGGVYVATGTVISNTIVNNSAPDRDGGGMYVSDSMLVGNLIADNKCSRGGGVFATGSTLTDNTISGNSASSLWDIDGGGIYASGCTISGNTVSGNRINSSWRSVRGGGIYADGGTVIDNIVTGNVTGAADNARGGGIYASLGTVSGNTVEANIATGGMEAFGGGIYASSSTVEDNVVTSNAANAASSYIGYGGGIFAEGGSVQHNTIRNNTASGKEGRGGGVYGDTSAVQDNTITGNTANLGGAVYGKQGSLTANTILSNTTQMTGTVYMEGGTAAQNVIRNNSASYGGGLYSGNANVVGNTIQDNQASLAGGGVYARVGTVNGNTITDNSTANNGGGLYATGGVFNGNTISNNEAPSWGHGSGAYVSGTAQFSYNTVISNTASGGAVGGVAIDGQPQVQYNNLYNNQPYDAEVVSAAVVTATLNYWGPIACADIAGKIYDGDMLPGLGELIYAPSLYEPLPLSRLAGPSNLILDANSTTLTFTWTAAPDIPPLGCRQPGASEPELGYQLYYSTADFCASPKGTGLPLGDSPIDLGQTTIFTMPVPTDSYTFTVTAYDYLGRESLITNQVAYFTGNTNHAPYEPTHPSPVDGATNVPISQTLTWSGGDPDGDVVTYTIAFGSVNPPPIVATSQITSYTPPIISGTINLLNGIKYYWTIAASDGLSESIGSLWTFTTTGTAEPQYYIYLPVVLKQN